MLTNFSGVKPHEWISLRSVFTELPFSECNQDENVDDNLNCGMTAAPSNAVNDCDVHLQALFSKATQLRIAHLNKKSMVSSFGELQTTLAEYLIIDRPDYHQNLDEK